jgi:hypothetical protein
MAAATRRTASCSSCSSSSSSSSPNLCVFKGRPAEAEPLAPRVDEGPTDETLAIASGETPLLTCYHMMKGASEKW